MRYVVFFVLFCWGIHLLPAQVVCSSGDSLRFKEKMQNVKSIRGKHLGDSLIFIGKTFLGTPYVEKTLEVGKTEQLVINLSGLDCTTFVENVLAFGKLVKNESYAFEDFTQSLQTIRYRDGVLNGYPSRLHYFTDWIRNNAQKGLVKDITNELGGEIVSKPINFMGTHRNLYPFLSSDENHEAILEVEAGLAKEELCILQQKQIAEKEHLIQSGDIIALATSINGLDVTHTGLAIKKDGRIHLLHASSAGEVTVTEQPLVDYLKKIKNNTGIIVARPVF
ncbi:MAG: N-acetylmuramoyl-L-alanine amidase-like domain-containing protein [Bacteroidota bacterium]